ncbi:MAG: cob(I)yrinic acid a,c-diamide adenosyltransferase [Vallitaleaceae bacterium]|nr:cob(I)yrinic acid a,c-diamide adenosyltransferase [Vallitaleaceae bacterium]
MKIYTKKGDQGFTTNIKGEKISKGDLMIELQGSIDEVNAGVGYLRSICNKMLTSTQKLEIDQNLKDIQHTLFRIGGDVTYQFAQLYVKEEDLQALEKGIDSMTEKTGELKNFIYYSGHVASTYCQVLRSVTRRAERVFVRAIEGQYEATLDYQYMNRLADYFFTLGRYLNLLEGEVEEVMKLK